MLGLKNDDWKGLWAVFWRIFVVVPVAWTLGMVFLVVVLAALFIPPIYALIAFMGGDWLPGMAALVGWAIVMRFRRPLLRWTLAGIEYAGI